jgi:hypothetical protein
MKKLTAGYRAAIVVVLSQTSVCVGSAQQNEPFATQTGRPEAVWTASVDAPPGTLSHDHEAQRHDRFIEMAQSGDIDLVFFGTTETEMWSWRDRGQSVWDEAFGSLDAANFGSQGTSFSSLLWRMRNGELDGYQAKLVVLHTWGGGGAAISDDQRAELAAGYAAIIGEIRSRQPQAGILLSAPFPRGEDRFESWQPQSEAYAGGLSDLVDDETVFYIEIGERFFLPDGSHNQEMWRFPMLAGPVNVGAQTAAFEVWAEQLQPWLDRFVR